MGSLENPTFSADLELAELREERRQLSQNLELVVQKGQTAFALARQLRKNESEDVAQWQAEYRIAGKHEPQISILQANRLEVGWRIWREGDVIVISDQPRKTLSPAEKKAMQHFESLALGRVDEIMLYPNGRVRRIEGEFDPSKVLANADSIHPQTRINAISFFQSGAIRAVSGQKLLRGNGLDSPERQTENITFFAVNDSHSGPQKIIYLAGNIPKPEIFINPKKYQAPKFRVDEIDLQTGRYSVGGKKFVLLAKSR